MIVSINKNNKTFNINVLDIYTTNINELPDYINYYSI